MRLIMSLTPEAVENAARLVLNQLSERFNFSKHGSNNDDEMECLQFGICAVPVRSNHQQRVIL